MLSDNKIIYKCSIPLELKATNPIDDKSYGIIINKDTECNRSRWTTIYKDVQIVVSFPDCIRDANGVSLTLESVFTEEQFKRFFKFEPKEDKL